MLIHADEFYCFDRSGVCSSAPLYFQLGVRGGDRRGLFTALFAVSAVCAEGYSGGDASAGLLPFADSLCDSPVDGLLKNREMVVTIAAFAITVVIVYLLRRMSIDYAWTIAMTAGAVVNIMVLLVGDLIFDINQPLIGVILGTVISFLITLVLQFFVFYVDYSRTEKVQFEDDEYYYYVKAVPKVTVAKPDKKVKQINSARSGASRNTRPTRYE